MGVRVVCGVDTVPETEGDLILGPSFVHRRLSVHGVVSRDVLTLFSF